jgi:hypothetical protein
MEFFEGRLRGDEDFLGKNIGIGKIVGLFEALVSEPNRSKLALWR